APGSTPQPLTGGGLQGRELCLLDPRRSARIVRVEGPGERRRAPERAADRAAELDAGAVGAEQARVAEDRPHGAGAPAAANDVQGVPVLDPVPGLLEPG